MSDALYLGEFEQLVLLAVLRCGDDAYGMAVRRELQARAQRDAAIGAVYATLDRLETKGLVRSERSGSGREGGGRARRRFLVTAAGKRALDRAHGALHRMRAGLGLGGA